MDQNIGFKDPMDDWINNQSKFKQTSHRRETIQDIHASEIDKESC